MSDPTAPFAEDGPAETVNHPPIPPHCPMFRCINGIWWFLFECFDMQGMEMTEGEPLDELGDKHHRLIVAAVAVAYWLNDAHPHGDCILSGHRCKSCQQGMDNAQKWEEWSKGEFKEHPGLYPVRT